MKEIYRPKNLPEAHMIRLFLANSGITAVIDGEQLQGVVGELPMGWVTAPRIMVEDSLAEQARELVLQAISLNQQRLDAETDDQTHCLACGEIIAGNQDRCPACGWSFVEGDVD